MDRPTVLLVGEGERMKAALEAALDRHGILVESVRTEAVMEAAFAAAPDIILVIGEATKDAGRGVLARLAGHPATSLVPVVLLSDEPHLDRRLDAFKHGVVAVVPRTASADGMARRIAELARELPDRTGEQEGELGEATVDDLVQLFSQKLRGGILSVSAGSEGASAQVVLREGRPVTEAIEELVERLRPMIQSDAGPLRYEFHEAPAARVNLLDGEEQEPEGTDLLRGRRILVIEKNPARADVLVQELRANGALVVVADGEGAGLDRARLTDPEVVVIDGSGVQGWALPTLRALRREPRLRWASLLVVDGSDLWPASGAPPKLARLTSSLRTLIEPDRELATRATNEPRFDSRLELVGPSRLLRALTGTSLGLRITVSHPRARIEVDVADGLIAGARAMAPGGNAQLAEGPAAIAALLGLGSGRVRIERRDAPSTANVMSPVDDALAAAALEKPPIKPSLPPPGPSELPREAKSVAPKETPDPALLIGRLEELVERLGRVVPEEVLPAAPSIPPRKPSVRPRSATLFGANAPPPAVLPWQPLPPREDDEIPIIEATIETKRLPPPPPAPPQVPTAPPQVAAYSVPPQSIPPQAISIPPESISIPPQSLHPQSLHPQSIHPQSMPEAAIPTPPLGSPQLESGSRRPPLFLWIAAGFFALCGIGSALAIGYVVLTREPETVAERAASEPREVPAPEAEPRPEPVRIEPPPPPLPEPEPPHPLPLDDVPEPAPAPLAEPEIVLPRVPEPDSDMEPEEDIDQAGAVEPVSRRHDIQHLIRTANWQRNRNELNAAEATYLRVLRLERSNARALVGITRVYLARRDGRRAVQTATRLVDAYPTRAGNHVLLGDSYQLAGNRAGALREWRRALEIEPNHATARRRVAAL